VYTFIAESFCDNSFLFFFFSLKVVPTTDSGKIFTICYALVACCLAAKGFRDFVLYPLVLREKSNEMRIVEQFGDGLSERVLKSILQAEVLKKMSRFQRSKQSIHKTEFMVLILQLMNKIQAKDVLFASEIFDRLDLSKRGFFFCVCYFVFLFKSVFLVLFLLRSTE
jgi:hypothetical protein